MSDLIWGIKNGDLDQVKESMEKSKINVNEKVDGRAPIHYAADYGQKEVIEFLISSGADVNVLDKHGISPLLAAIWEGHTDCVELLLQKGASSKGTTPEGTSYIEAAEKTEIRELLLKN